MSSERVAYHMETMLYSNDSPQQPIMSQLLDAASDNPSTVKNQKSGRINECTVQYKVECHRCTSYDTYDNPPGSVSTASVQFPLASSIPPPLTCNMYNMHARMCGSIASLGIHLYVQLVNVCNIKESTIILYR